MQVANNVSIVHNENPDMLMFSGFSVFIILVKGVSILTFANTVALNPKYTSILS